jgi:hypothetical protein
MLYTVVGFSMNGKGDRQRPRLVNSEEWDRNWEMAFGGKTHSKEAACGLGTNPTTTLETNTTTSFRLAEACLGSVSPGLEHEIKSKLRG